MTQVIFTGFMASGKSAVGRRLARRLRRPFIDLDQQIEKREGRSITAIFDSDGEAAFREMERAAVDVLAGEPESVIATGGGTFVDPVNRGRLRELGVVVYLATGLETIIERVSRNEKRPLASGEDAEQKIRDLWQQRLPVYRQADIMIETDGLTVDQSAARVQRMIEPWLKGEAPARKEVGTGDGSDPERGSK